jgi:hypothetical protein
MIEAGDGQQVQFIGKSVCLFFVKAQLREDFDGVFE